MGLFDNFPYTNFHELNLDWILKVLKDIETTIDQFVSLNIIKYADPIQWDITRQYPKNTIVIDPISGTAYISVDNVPQGVALSNTDYWSVVFDLGRFITLAAQNFAISYEPVLTTTATMPTLEGGWIVWNSLLYEALNDIHIGDRYVEDGNIKKTPVEVFFNRLKAELNTEILDRIAADNALGGRIDQEILDRQDADNALGGHIDQEILDRQNADNALDTKIGNLSDLDTSDKTSIVNAINSLDAGTAGDIEALRDDLNTFADSRNEIIVNVKDYGATGNGVTDDYNSIMDAFNSLPSNGGTVYFPAGNYRISQPIAIGDGTAATTNNGHASTKQNIKIIGAGCNRGGTPKVTQITPLTHISAIINVRGLINNVLIDGFNLYANGMADYGLFICATNYSTFKNIEIYNPTYCGLAVIGGHLPTGNYNTGCVFKQIIVTLATSSTIGLRITGDINANNDTWLTTFEDCRFQSMGNTSSCTSGEFRFCDNITFIRCHFVTYSSSGRGIDLNALDSISGNPFPTGLSFIDCSIANTAITEDPANGKLIGTNRFYGYGITDGEVLPPKDARLIGFDGSGRPFNGFGQFTMGNLAGLTKVLNQLCNQSTMSVVYGGVVTQRIWGVQATMFGQICRVTDTKCFAFGVNANYIKFAELDNSGTPSNVKTINFT